MVIVISSEDEELVKREHRDWSQDRDHYTRLNSTNQRPVPGRRPNQRAASRVRGDNLINSP